MTVVDESGTITTQSHIGVSYYWPHQIVRKSQSLNRLKAKEADLYAAKGKDFALPASMLNNDAIYETVSSSELPELIDLDESEIEVCEKHLPTVYFCYMYSAKVWQTFNESLQVRQNVNVLSGGIQISANNMPQGELIQIPLKRNIGRQNQVLFMIHFENCRGDLGRKGFQKEIVEFCESISRKIIDKPIQQFRYTLRPVTGVRGDLLRESQVDNWKEEMEKHEQQSPLQLVNENFFIPMRRIAITSTPTREQDVIALFNQLIAGGVIRGIRIMSTNERLASVS